MCRQFTNCPKDPRYRNSRVYNIKVNNFIVNYVNSLKNRLCIIRWFHCFCLSPLGWLTRMVGCDPKQTLQHGWSGSRTHRRWRYVIMLFWQRIRLWETRICKTWSSTNILFREGWRLSTSSPPNLFRYCGSWLRWRVSLPLVYEWVELLLIQKDIW